MEEHNELSRRISSRVVDNVSERFSLEAAAEDQLEALLTELLSEALRGDELSELAGRLATPSVQRRFAEGLGERLEPSFLTRRRRLRNKVEDALLDWQATPTAHTPSSSSTSPSSSASHSDTPSLTQVHSSPSVPHYTSLPHISRLVTAGRLNEIERSELTQEAKPFAAGSYGAVYRGQYQDESVAIKQLNAVGTHLKLEKALKREALNLSKIASPYIVALRGVCLTPPYALVMEYCYGGSLEHLLHSSLPLSWSQRWLWGRELTEGLSYVHAEQIVHRDVAARNVLLTGDGHIKLTDFGLAESKLYTEASQPYHKKEDPSEKKEKLPWAWSAPEVLNGGVSTAHSDMYSVGMVLWEMSSREIPYKAERLRGKSAKQLIKSIKSGYREHIGEETPEGFGGVIRHCWASDPTVRPDARAALVALTVGQMQAELGLKGSYSQDAQADATIAQLQQQVVTVQQQSQQWHSQVSQLQGTYQQVQSQFTQECQAHEQTRNELQGAKKTLVYQEKQLAQLEQTLAHKETELSSQSEINRVLSEEQRKQQSALEKMANQMKARDRSLNHVARVTSPARDGTAGGSLVKGRAAAHVTEVSKQTWKALDAKSSRRGLFKKELSALFKYVVEGHLDEVDQRLKKTPALALCQSDVTDLSGRTFKQITVFQYAAWALDADMWDMILRYLDSQEAATQLSALEQDRIDIIQAYGAHYSLDALISHYETYIETYIKNYNQWDDDQLERYWCKEIGGAQRMCPAWYIYAMCEPGDDAAWVKQDISRGFNRAYDMKYGLTWWMTQEYAGGKLGYKWAALRADRDDVGGVPVWVLYEDGDEWELWHDADNTQQCKTHVGKRLGTLKQQLGVGRLTQSSQGKGFGQ